MWIGITILFLDFFIVKFIINILDSMECNDEMSAGNGYRRVNV